MFGYQQNGNYSWQPPTIDELVAANGSNHASPARAGAWANQSTKGYSTAGDGGGVFDEATDDELTATSLASFALTQMGAILSEYSPENIFSSLACRFVGKMPAYFAARTDVTPVFDAAANGHAPQSPLQLTAPTDRLAMRTPPPRSDPWCVPQALYQQLDRLSEHAYSARWASFVGNQLRALTERTQLEGDDVQAILGDLSSATQDALIMAENTGDDRLRVELLRAHWALARRLDCWTALHEERTAFRAQGRVAARGDLNPYFNGGPSQTTDPDELTALTKSIELYEETRDPQLAQGIVAKQRTLAGSPASFDRAIADAVEQHYRNANVRVAITAEMVNRMMAKPRTESRPVRDKIAGAFVSGQSEIYANTKVDLAPAQNEWQMKVNTSGMIQSNTMASSGPAQLRSRGQIDFSGTKNVVVRPDGVHLQPSDVEATSRNRLVGVTTDYDWVPIFGGFARDRATQQYRAKQSWVRSATESRASDEASETLDRETHDALERIRKNIYERFTSRFDEYGIKLSTVEMRSTPERLVARVRLAGDDQLGSHTPRPRALSDSLASVQVHESALNNLAVTLGLDGQQLTAEELQQKLRERFPNMAKRDPIEVQRDTVFHFAPKNAVQFRIADGKLELRLAFDAVELDGTEMSDIIVHAMYTPTVNGLNADLSRDGPLGIEGQFGAGERARLHNIFQSVLPPERVLPMVRLNDDKPRHLEGLMITQLVMEDGWLGLAFGPEAENRTAERSRSLVR
jgi:hypothetical protein